jgi:hypothetical protein
MSQSDVRFGRGELVTLKSVARNSRIANTETKYHYADCIERIALILDPK